MERKGKTAEDFTPSWLVNQMLDKLIHYAPNYFTDPTKTFLDPAAGNGNMLVEVLKRKLANNHSPLQALNTTYGCDIMKDNIQECRERLLNIVKDNGHTITFEMAKAVVRNIVWTPLCHYQNGSLDYEFNFLSPDNRVVQNLLDVMNGTRKSTEEDVKDEEQPTLFDTCMRDEPKETKESKEWEVSSAPNGDFTILK